MKVFVLAPQEDWICDRLAKEWYESFPEISTRNPYEADVIWILAGWCWNHLPQDLLRSKKVIVTEHHIVPEKFNVLKHQDFVNRDQFVDAYHVPCKKTKDQIKNLTLKPVYSNPFWVNENIWFNIDKKKCRSDLNFPQDKFLIGSFQRDTEGSDLNAPKLEKGPDLFVEVVKKFSQERDDVCVILGGWRRCYLTNRLNELNIDYIYKRLPDFEILNKMYNSLDLYIVSSRHEGGPQSIVECAMTRTPIVSTDVGLASELMNSISISSYENLHKAIPDSDYLYQKCNQLKMSELGMKNFKNIFNSL
jgi:glycosyltransferase involved in cell wall biosynthesis